MKKSKTEAKKIIDDFFKNIKSRTAKEVKKIKVLAMSYNIPLKENRKLFCKKCLMPYSGKEKIRVKNKIKAITCDNCTYLSRWRL